jgi:hypothetical protein
MFIAGLALAATLSADFRYDTTSRVTKGMAARFGNKAGDTSTNYYKGDRMAVVSKDSHIIMDFAKEEFITIDTAKKQYWRMTFAEMQQAMADAEAEFKEKTKGKDVNLNMKFDAKATGVEKEVSGYPAKQVLFTIETSASAEGQQGGALRITNDSWQSEAVPGYSEFRAFMKRMEGKGKWLAARNPAMSAQPGMAEGMQRLIEEMQKTPGLPVLTITRMTMPGMNLNLGGGGLSAGDAASRSIGSGLGGALGGALGGKLGGFGRRKKNDAPAEAEAPTPKENAAGEGMLMMEMFTDASNFSTAAIPDSIFTVPADCKQVEPEFGPRKRRR